MNQTVIFWPMVAHVLLVYIAYGVLRVRRFAAVRSGAAKPNQFKTRGAEPDLSASAYGNILNQFELPVLFHVCCVVLFLTSGVNYLVLALAWIFVLSRYVHAWVHLTSNTIRLRSNVFIVGTLVLAIMWIWFALHLAGVV